VHPALSVIFFTTLSGAGYGLLMWLGALVAAEYLAGYRAEGSVPLFWAACLCAAALLVTVGLLSSMLHLGKPARAWRSFSQWRTSWLSREGVSALLTYLPVVALLAMIATSATRPSLHSSLHTPLLPASATVMAICAAATVFCTAMIYSSLRTIPAWRHRLVVPAYLAFALLSGGAMLAAMSGFAGSDAASAQAFAVMVGASAVLTALLKLAYWRAIDSQRLPATRGDAVGMPGREIGVFERPHTEESYVTREMAFAVARKHARGLRAIALVLFGVTPILAAAAAARLTGAAGVAFTIAALSVLAGAFIERWLFFAEARHVVTLYY
jgi:DMSO reductase anchor subunit